MTRGVHHLYLQLPPSSDGARAGSARAPSPVPGGRWGALLARERDLRCGDEAALDPLRTLLVGGEGGALPAEPLEEAVRRIVGGDLPPDLEWTIEVDPREAGAGRIEGWRRAGATRLHLTVESTDDATLRWLGRMRSADATREAMRQAAASGVGSWGVRVLFGLPPAIGPSPLATLREAVDLGASHLSLAEYVPEEAGPAPGAGAAAETVPAADEDLKADQYLEAASFLEAAGYEAWEMTAFAFPGHASEHVRAGYRGCNVLGLGPGARSWQAGVGWANLSDWTAYCQAVTRGELPGAPVRLSREDRRWIDLWSRLRLHEGVPVAELPPGGTVLARRWAALGWSRPDPDRLRLTAEGWLRLDGLVHELLLGAPRGDEGGMEPVTEGR